MSPRVVLVGAGLAAQRCAETLRAVGHDGPIAMLGAEPRPPYDRPPLSKAVLAGEDLDLGLRPAGWHAGHDVDLRLGTVVRRLRPRERRLELAGGERVPYDRLLIATGAAPVIPAALRGGANVQALRTLQDALRLRGALGRGVRLAIVGAGLVGQEVAAAAVAAGAWVTVIDVAARPFDALLGPALGGWLERLHRDAGVDLRLARRVTGVAGTGRVHALRLDDGAQVACDHVLVATGVRPATAWLAGSRLDPRGPVIDAEGRTRLPRVFAAGDAACAPDALTGRHRPAGHWEAAARQGAAAARAMLDLPMRPAAPAVVWSDQYGVRLQRIGDPRGADRVTVDGDLRGRDFVLTYYRAGRTVAAALAGRPQALPGVRRRLLATGAIGPEQEAA
jgi:3-phenylpropionate/trans-cinnamate dioxygenase ferredoxin reductase subunit